MTVMCVRYICTHVCGGLTAHGLERVGEEPSADAGIGGPGGPGHGEDVRLCGVGDAQVVAGAGGVAHRRHCLLYTSDAADE